MAVVRATACLRLVVLVIVLPLGPPDICVAQSFAHRKSFRVTQDGRLDWTYVATGKSGPEQDDTLTPDYHSKAQRFELYAPLAPNPASSYPAILFVSHSKLPIGWRYVGGTCIRNGVVYIGPHGAGNSTPYAQRVRIVLDCFDEVRRRIPLDPDRTYIAGYSGGGIVAAKIATVLPEYFGGLIASSMTVPIPASPWLRDRMIHRLSIASIVGQNEFSGIEMPRINIPFMQ